MQRMKGTESQSDWTLIGPCKKMKVQSGHQVISLFICVHPSILLSLHPTIHPSMFLHFSSTSSQLLNDSVQFKDLFTKWKRTELMIWFPHMTEKKQIQKSIWRGRLLQHHSLLCIIVVMVFVGGWQSWWITSSTTRTTQLIWYDRVCKHAVICPPEPCVNRFQFTQSLKRMETLK